MATGQHDGGQDGEYDGTDFLGISKIFVMRDAIFFGTISFVSVIPDDGLNLQHVHAHITSH